MPLDYETLELLRRNHPAWRLLNAQHAPLIASFLHRVFIAPNVRQMAQADLVELLEDTLFNLREQRGLEVYKGTAQSYLNEWAENDKGWLRKFYLEGTDEPYFDLTPATEKSLTWLDSLTERAFVGTESRLLTIFELLRQMSEGRETDPQVRIDELQKRRNNIDAEIDRIFAGDIPLLDDTELKDRFQQFLQLAKELLMDFREVEQNFRLLDRRVRERIALREGTKGALLEEIMNERDAITDSDQGRSFRAFWDFLMSQSRQEEFGRQIEQVLALEPVQEMQQGRRLHRVHYDWLEAGEHTQKMVAKLSEQLRHFLDDQAWLENRRIMDILHNIETRALALRDNLPAGDFMPLTDTSASIDMPLERPMFRPSLKQKLESIVTDQGDAYIDTAALYAQVRIDRNELLNFIQQELQAGSQVSLAAVIKEHPLRFGLAELIAYLQIVGADRGTGLEAVVDEEIEEQVNWLSETGINRQAILPRVIFLRKESGLNRQGADNHD